MSVSVAGVGRAADVSDADTSPSTAEEAVDSSSGPAYPSAPWPRRAGALLLDVVPGALAAATLGTASLTLDGGARWVAVVVAGLIVAAMGANRWLVPTVAGATLGRAAFGVAVVRRGAAPDAPAPSPWWLALRDLAHVLDTLSLGVGWLWPLWDGRARTFADLLCRTEALAVGDAPADVASETPPRTPRGARARAAAALAVMTSLAVVGAAVVALTVWWPAHAAQRSRAEIEVQGPELVSEVLSYGAATADDDFARARTLVTDGFRDVFVAQQAAAQLKGVTDNEFWAQDSAVEAADADRATMLVFLRGQRGDDPAQQALLSATVRAQFERAGDGRWLVADIAVLGDTR